MRQKNTPGAETRKKLPEDLACIRGQDAAGCAGARVAQAGPG